MNQYFLSIGSNVNPEIHVQQCIELLRARFPRAKFSSVYETSPVGPAGDKKFWNLCALILSSKPKEKIREELREIEEQLGRKRDPANRYAPRTMDIDILPEPGYQDQAFIMVPLAEIAPEEIDSESGKSFQALVEKFKEEAKQFRKVLAS